MTGTWPAQLLFFFNPYVSAAPPFAYEAEGELLHLVCGLVLKVLSQGEFWWHCFCKYTHLLNRVSSFGLPREKRLWLWREKGSRGLILSFSSCRPFTQHPSSLYLRVFLYEMGALTTPSLGCGQEHCTASTQHTSWLVVNSGFFWASISWSDFAQSLFWWVFVVSFPYPFRLLQDCFLNLDNIFLISRSPFHSSTCFGVPCSVAL